jgi:hypothetical protein
MAAKTLAKHRKALERAPIRAKARAMCADMGKEIPAVLQ